MFGIDDNQNGLHEILGVDTNDDGAIDQVALDLNEIVGGTPTYDGVGNLLVTMAGMTARATSGSGDSDRDGYHDANDRHPYDPRSI